VAVTGDRPRWVVSKPVDGPFSCSSCGAAKPDATTWPQACPVCSNEIWTSSVVFTAEEIEAAQRAAGSDPSTSGES
jgi:hypothetical protein